MSIRFLLAIIVLLSPISASAQSILDSSMSASADPFSVSVAPQYPAPYGEAVLSFLSSTLDLSNSTLSVSAGGKNIYQGNVRPVTISLGKAGSATNILITLSSAGTTYTKSVVIQPQDVSLIAEPLSSSPPLYAGKSLVPLEGDTRVVAIANLRDFGGKTIDPAMLSYSWTIDGMYVANSSGIGKLSVIVASPLRYRQRSVSVAVQNQTGSLVGGATLSLSPQEPSVHIYENDPLLGVRFGRVLAGNYVIGGTEKSLYAASFSFPLAGGAPFMQWFLNGTSAQTGSTITLRPTGSGQGNASLSLTVSAGTSANATANLSLSFGAKPGTNFFGL